MRIKNTYFSLGDLSLEEALEELDKGIYAIRTAGGQANMDGTFMFKASQGYYVKNGEKNIHYTKLHLQVQYLTFLKISEAPQRNFSFIVVISGDAEKASNTPYLLVLEDRTYWFRKSSLEERNDDI